jgi:hypothetical protein
VSIGAKRIETRGWSTSYTGLIAIHASKKFPDDDMDLCSDRPFKEALQAACYYGPADLPTGSIVGTAVLRGCRFTQDIAHQISQQELAFGNFEPGRFGWFLHDARLIIDPIRCKGALGLWTVPEDVAEQIRKAVPA